MKKLYLLLSYTVCLSSTFAADRALSSDFDDCSTALDTGCKGLVAPQNSPQIRPEALEEVDSLTQLLLLASEKGDEGDSASPQETLKADEGVKDSAIPQNNSAHSPDLKIYYPERDGDETSLKRFTVEMLTADYAKLGPGGVLEAKFMPEITLLQDATCTSVDQPISKSIFDTIGWLANVRAWAKWYLNPWAWWNPSVYSLDANGDSVEWDGVACQATIRLTTGKDVTYLASQLRLFLLKGWVAKFAPYVAPVTQETLERAVMSRFENIEKRELEAVGFKNVTLATWVNPRTQQLERVIRAIK